MRPRLTTASAAMRTLDAIALGVGVTAVVTGGCGSRPQPPRAHAPAIHTSPATHTEVAFIAPSPARVFRPNGVVVHSTGTVYILDGRDSRIKRFSGDGKFERSFACDAPDGLVETPHGMLALDAEAGILRRFDFDGERGQVITIDTPADRFYRLRVACDDAGSIYVAHEGEAVPSSILKAFSPRGRLLWQRSVARPIDALAVDERGSLWAWSQDRMFRVGKTGDLRLNDARPVRRGGPADMIAAGFRPTGGWYELWFDTVAGYGTDLVRFDGNGKELWRHNWLAVEGTGLALGPKGHAFVTLVDYKFTAPVCVEVDGGGAQLRVFGSNGTAPGELRDPSGLAIDGEGHILVGDYYNYRIQRFSTAGSFLGKVAGPDLPHDFPESQDRGEGQWLDPCAISIDSRGLIYVTHHQLHGSDQTVSVLSPTGRIVRAFPNLALGYGGIALGQGHFGGSPRFPADVAVDSRGYLWTAIVLDPTFDEDRTKRRIKWSGRGIRVAKLDRQGKELLSFGGRGSRAREFGTVPVKWEGIGPALLAVDDEDNIWVADPGNNRVQKFTENGKYVSEIRTVPSRMAGLRMPWGVAVDTRGHVFVADATRICEFDAQGDFLAVAAYLSEKPPSPDDYYVWPYRALVGDAAGNLYVTDAATDSVRKFVPGERN